MYTKALFAVASLALVQPASGQVTPPPVLEVAGPTTFEAGKKAVIKVTTTAKKVSWKIPPGCDTEALDGRRLAVWANPGTYLFVAMVPVGDDVVTIDYPVTITQGPRPPPGPGPIPDDPVVPPVVKSFRVIWVTESATTPTAGQNSVIGAKAVREYLTAKTTAEGNVAGWRHYDPQTSAANDQPTMRALWDAAKAKVTAVPCVIVEVNGKAEILPFPANAVEALKVLKQYGGQ